MSAMTQVVDANVSWSTVLKRQIFRLFQPRRFECAAVLGTVKAWPGSVGVSGERSATASLRQPLRATARSIRGPGRRNGFRPNRETELG